MSTINYESLVDGTPITANIFNERFGEIISVINGGLDQSNFASGGIPASALATSVYEQIYPVGSLYFNSIDATNPETLLGFGTWVAFGAGKVPVGYDATDTDFNAAEKTGGSKLPQSHSHTATTSSNGDHSHTVNGQVAFYTASTVGLTNLKTDQFSWGTASTNTTGAHAHTLTTDTSGTGTAGNLQPFIAVYVWKRTA